MLGGDLAGRDVFALIEETTGLLLGRADVVVHAVTADPDTAALLEIPLGAAVFAIERLTRLPDGVEELTGPVSTSDALSPRIWLYVRRRLSPPRPRRGVAELGTSLDAAIGPIKSRARGHSGGELLVGLAAAQLAGGGGGRRSRSRPTCG